MLKGTANYKIGKTYAFEINGVTTVVKVISKPYKKLELEFDGVKKIYDWSELSPVKKHWHPAKIVEPKTVVQKPPALKVDITPKLEVVSVAKELPKEVIKKENLASKPIPKTISEKVVDPIVLEKVNDLEYSFKRFKMDVRLALKRHGVHTEPTWGLNQIIDALRKALPPKN